MFFIVERCVNDKWIATGFLLEGEFRKHMEFLDRVRDEFPGMDFRARRITPQLAEYLKASGMSLYKAPKTNV